MEAKNDFEFQLKIEIQYSLNTNRFLVIHSLFIYQNKAHEKKNTTEIMFANHVDVIKTIFILIKSKASAEQEL